MNFKDIIENIKKFWHWTWNSESILSWIVALVLIFIFVKLIFFPTLSFITASSLPLAGVESSSMDHNIVKDDYGILNICGQMYLKKESVNFDKYWEVCGNWYEERNISKETFSKFSLKNGFSKGDIIIVWGRFIPKIGNIIIFKPNKESIAPRPIIHRIISIEDDIIQTKGDHNQAQLIVSNNIYKTDETAINKEQIIGKAVFKIPYLGWVKIWAVEILNAILK